MSQMLEVDPKLIEACARAAHEVNRAYCIGIGDNTQKSWEDAEQWQRDSALRGVKVALAGAGPEQQHEAWCKDKIADGWKHGPVKDADKKEHPCLVPYADLPQAQKFKDGLYIATVTQVAAALGINYLANMRVKLDQCIEKLRSVSNDDLAMVLDRLPYKVGETWMVNDPAPDLSKSMGYPCFEAHVLK